MESSKLIVTHGRNLATMFGAEGTAAIDEAVGALISADAGRGIRTHYVHIDDVEEMRRYGSKAVSKNPAASSCKRVIDKICNSVAPDYIVLLGSDEIIPHFRVPNPTFAEDGDTDRDVATDNPYASSSAFNAKARASYLVSDRVVGRIPEIPGQSNPEPLIDYLNAAATSKPMDLAEFALDLMVCCETWRKSGGACVAEISRELTNLFISPPTDVDTADFHKRHTARVQMIKCHGAPFDPHFYGQEGESFPAVLYSGSLTGKTTPGTVVGAMCCFGAAVYDPSHPAAVIPGAESLANVYLKQGAAGFAGSTGTSWVGVTDIGCADLIVCRFLTNVMAGMSLGAALLDSKQRFLADINKDGRMIDAAEGKTPAAVPLAW